MNSNIILRQNNLDAYLPKDIFFEISTILPHNDWITIGGVCKLWQEHSDYEIIWKRYAMNRWPDYTKLPNISWKEHFQSNFKGSFYNSLNQSNAGFHCAKNNILYLLKPDDTFPVLKKSSHTGSINQIIIHSFTDPIYIITCASDGYVKIWNNNADEDCLFEKKIHSKGVTCMELIKDTLFTGGEDGSIKIWKLEFNQKYSLNFITELKEGEEAITCFKINKENPFSHQICSGSRDTAIRIWKLKSSGESLLSQTLKSHQSAITILKMQKRTNCLISGSIDKMIKIWSTNQNNLYECVQTLDFHQSTITALIANPLSPFFYSTDNSGHIVVWRYFEQKWYFESTANNNGVIYDMKFKEKRPQVFDFTHFFSLGTDGEISGWTVEYKPVDQTGTT